jgi:hypothetical protein
VLRRQPSVLRRPFLAPLALLRGQPAVRPVCEIFLPLKFSYLYGSEVGGRKIGWVRKFSGPNLPARHDGSPPSTSSFSLQLRILGSTGASVRRPPLCPRSVASVTQSVLRPPSSDSCAHGASSRPTLSAVVSPPPAAFSFPPRRPSPASSVSALRGLCATIRPPPSVVRRPSSVLRRPIFAPMAPLRGQPCPPFPVTARPAPSPPARSR